MDQYYSIDDIVRMVNDQGMCHALNNIEAELIRDVPLSEMWTTSKRMLDEIQDYLNSGG